MKLGEDIRLDGCSIGAYIDFRMFVSFIVPIRYSAAVARTSATTVERALDPK